MCRGGARNQESVKRDVAEAEKATDGFNGLTYAICGVTLSDKSNDSILRLTTANAVISKTF